MQRRKFILTAITGSVAGLAGCGGSNSGGGASSGDSSGTGGECPSLPLSYTEVTSDETPSFSVEFPEGAETSEEDRDVENENTLSADFDAANIGATPHLISVNAKPIDADTVDEALDVSESYSADSETIEEITGEYEVAVSGTQVYNDTVADGRFVMFIPTTSNVLRVQIGSLNPPGQTVCPEAATAAVEHAVETFEPV